MIEFAVRVEDTLGTRVFFEERKKFLFEVKDVSKNPFTGHCMKMKVEKGRATWFFQLQPVYPKLWPYGFYLAAIIAFFARGDFTFWYIAPALLLLTGIFWWPGMFILAMRKALRKAGYTGSLQVVRDKTELTGYARKINDDITALI